jgi:hypothetical protein
LMSDKSSAMATLAMTKTANAIRARFNFDLHTIRTFEWSDAIATYLISMNTFSCAAAA